MNLFTLKYQPRSLHEIYGQDLAIAQLRDFVVNYQKQRQKAALLYGPIGNGKTSSVYALAGELGYEVLEINSSQLRNADAITTFLSSALGQQSLFFKPKIILIDEIDNISGVKDRGCASAIMKSVQKSSFPVILTANDPSDDKLKALRKVSMQIEFPPVPYQAIATCLKQICEKEHIHYEEKALNSLARQVDGDVRAALIDLQIAAIDGTLTFERLAFLSDRKRTESILQALTIIFKSSSVDNALPALDDVDVQLNEIFLWLDANLPKEYVKAADLARAYEQLARADVFNGRIRRQQHWRFMVYIYNLLTAGISSAKDEKNNQFVQYKRTMRLLQIWQANMRNAKKKEIAAKLAVATHISNRQAMHQIPFLQTLFRHGTCNELATELALTEDEVDWLRK